MKRFTASFLSALLAVTLLLTTQTMAMARGANAAVDEIHICSGHQTVVLHLDAKGEPTAAPHICPDCALFFAALQAEDTPVAPALTLAPLVVTMTGHKAGDVRTTHTPTARGPPVLI